MPGPDIADPVAFRRAALVGKRRISLADCLRNPSARHVAVHHAIRRRRRCAQHLRLVGTRIDQRRHARCTGHAAGCAEFRSIAPDLPDLPRIAEALAGAPGAHQLDRFTHRTHPPRRFKAEARRPLTAAADDEPRPPGAEFMQGQHRIGHLDRMHFPGTDDAHTETDAAGGQRSRHQGHEGITAGHVVLQPHGLDAGTLAELCQLGQLCGGLVWLKQYIYTHGSLRWRNREDMCGHDGTLCRSVAVLS